MICSSVPLMCFLWDSYKFRIVTSPFRVAFSKWFFLPMNLNLFNFFLALEKNKYLLFWGEIYDAQSSIVIVLLYFSFLFSNIFFLYKVFVIILFHDHRRHLHERWILPLSNLFLVCLYHFTFFLLPTVMFSSIYISQSILINYSSYAN